MDPVVNWQMFQEHFFCISVFIHGKPYSIEIATGWFPRLEGDCKVIEYNDLVCKLLQVKVTMVCGMRMLTREQKEQLELGFDAEATSGI